MCPDALIFVWCGAEFNYLSEEAACLAFRRFKRLTMICAKPSRTTKVKAGKLIPIKHANANALKMSGAAIRREKPGEAG